MKYRFIYLASQSPRRAQLLNQLGVAHRPLLPDPDEDAEALEAVEQGETAEHYVRRVTALKLEAALQRRHRRGLPEAPALCADTTVVLGRRILGKPDGPAQARAMLEALSGRTHRVLTAVAVGLGRQRLAALSVSRVRFEPLTPDAIDAYVRSGEPFGKAGAYAIQSAAAAWVPHIEGSYSGIMGLPLHETASLLRRSKVDFELAVSQG
ncbi:MAG: Maf family protein [Burkholderiaceae bacterium]|jgi:septum formation protein